MTTSVDRAAFRSRLEDRSRAAVLTPLCLDPLTARLCESMGFEAGYISGGALGYQLAVSEALLTVTELAGTARAIVRRSALPIIIDGGVGFGDAVHATRMVWEFEASGAAGVELEDQVVPKRVSHHRGVEHLIPIDEMVAKVRFAAEARRDPDFLLIARTGAVHNESLDAAVERVNAYAEAGADLVMLFPDRPEDWAGLAERVQAPLVAMVSLDYRPPAPWAELGVRMVIDPFTGQVAAFDGVRAAYAGQLDGSGSGRTLKEWMSVYRELPGLAGLDALYDIERATTEPGT